MCPQLISYSAGSYTVSEHPIFLALGGIWAFFATFFIPLSVGEESRPVLPLALSFCFFRFSSYCFSPGESTPPSSWLFFAFKPRKAAVFSPARSVFCSPRFYVTGPFFPPNVRIFPFFSLFRSFCVCVRFMPLHAFSPLFPPVALIFFFFFR